MLCSNQWMAIISFGSECLLCINRWSHLRNKMFSQFILFIDVTSQILTQTPDFLRYKSNLFLSIVSVYRCKYTVLCLIFNKLLLFFL